MSEVRTSGEVSLRKVYPVVPPKVEYSLSHRGESLRSLIFAMQTWGDAFLIDAQVPVSVSKKRVP